jgi:hypothetical protein
MAKLYTLTHRQQYCKTKDTYKSNLCIVNKETLLFIAGRFGISLPKSYSKEKMAEKLSNYVLKSPMKCLEQLSVKELEVLREAVKAGADTHVVRPNRRFYDTMRQLLLVSTFHHKKERKLYFLLPDELRELFAPLLDKAIKEEKKREKLEKVNNSKPPKVVFKGEDGREAFRLCTEEPDEVPGAIVGERVGGTERGRESRGRHTYRPSESEILRRHEAAFACLYLPP